MEIQKHLNPKLETKAFLELYPNKTPPKLKLNYSARFSEYNGNVKYKTFGRSITELTFSISNKFKDCEDEVQIGILQELINKVYKTKINTFNQDIYHNFIKHLTNYTKKGISHPVLKILFDQINLEYFNNSMEEPTLKLGQRSTSTLGKYNYSKDTITISKVFFDEDEKPIDINLIKYVLYHEMLHKKHKFTKVNNQHRHHTTAFRLDEAKYEDKDVEKKLKLFMSKNKLKKSIKNFSFFERKFKKFF